MDKSAIAVYNPQDVWERAVQDSYHYFNDDWLPSFACQLAAKAILKLKTVDWVLDASLRDIRAKYFFAPYMSSRKEEMVLVTHPLFLRDILENEMVNAYLHDPIVFVSPPIAFYLLRDYPIQIKVRWQDIASDNHDVQFIDVGAMYISSGQNVKLKASSIVEVWDATKHALTKAAAREIAPEVYEISKHHRNLSPQTSVYDKATRTVGTVDEVGIGEEAIIRVVYPNGEKVDIPQSDFDIRYIVHTAQLQSNPQVQYPVKLNGELYQLNERQIAALIKHKLVKSPTIRKLFDDFDVSPERLSELDIIITKLDQKYAETDLQQMKLDVSLFDDGDFFKHNFFVVAHEIVHWLSRIKEQDSYFNDPEEVLGFVSSVAVELENHEPLSVIWQKIYNKISWHFHNESDAQTFFRRMIEKAKLLCGPACSQNGV